MKKSLLILIVIFSVTASYCQDAHFDAQKYAHCELFVQKSDYDWQQRLSQIDSLENQEVTVFEIRAKDNQIKKSYTGKLEIPGKKNGKPRTKGQATVITVVVDENGQKTAYFPLTNDKRYRIYLTSCLH